MHELFSLYPGSPVVEYSNWGWQEPRADSSKSCVKQAKDGNGKWFWYSTDCTTKESFVCEIGRTALSGLKLHLYPVYTEQNYLARNLDRDLDREILSRVNT